jgi:prepilin-type N-terminal cleavage/methylation domain-containing protein
MERLRPGHDQRGFTLVELLVTMLIMGIVTTGITSVVISSLRTEQYQRQLQDVVDDGRLSLARIRKELRGARRVLESSTGSSLHFWVDQDQNSRADDPAELICYVVEPIGTTGRQWQISRWSHAEDPADCASGALPSGQSGSVVARTLVNPVDPTATPEPFQYAPQPGGIVDPPTRRVEVVLDLEVVGDRGPNDTRVEGSIRLRNVP